MGMKEFNTMEKKGLEKFKKHKEKKEKKDLRIYGELSEPILATPENLEGLKSRLDEIGLCSIEVRSYRTDLLAGGTTGITVTEYSGLDREEIQTKIMGIIKRNNAFPPVNVPEDFFEIWASIGYRTNEEGQLIRLDTARQGNPHGMMVSHEAYIRS